jgi:hypothetical protein
MVVACRTVLGAFALFTAVVALSWLAFPVEVGERMAMGFGSRLALSNARGDLGGLFAALSVLTVLAIRNTPEAPVWLAALALATGAVAIGRVVSIFADGLAVMGALALAAEVSVVAAALVLRSLRVAQRSRSGPFPESG